MHVLLCEDDDLIAAGICAGLTAQGLTVDRVGNAADARAMLQAAQFDVMILDLSLIHISEPTRQEAISRMPSSA